MTTGTIYFLVFIYLEGILRLSLQIAVPRLRLSTGDPDLHFLPLQKMLTNFILLLIDVELLSLLNRYIKFDS